MKVEITIDRQKKLPDGAVPALTLHPLAMKSVLRLSRSCGEPVMARKMKPYLG